MPGARAIGPTSPHQLIEISVVLKNRQPLNLSQHRGQTLSYSDFARTYGAEPNDIELIRHFARENNLEVLTRGDEIHRRTVTLAGTAADMEKAFNVELVGFEHPDGTYRSHTGPIQVPKACASVIQGIFGLDNRPVAHPHFRTRSTNRAFGSRASTTTYTPLQVASLYDFPPNADGDGQTIGIIELGGGYRPADLQQYFHGLNLRIPPVRAVLVDHANNRPSTPNSADAEVMLDIEIAGAVANGASLAVYFTSNTARGFQDALSTAVHDQLHTPSVLSISWGNAEETWSDQSMECFDQVAQEAALLGITIIVASGDNGSSEGMANNQNHVDFPASCPHVLGVGAHGSLPPATIPSTPKLSGTTALPAAPAAAAIAMSLRDRNGRRPSSPCPLAAFPTLRATRIRTLATTFSSMVNSQSSAAPVRSRPSGLASLRAATSCWGPGWDSSIPRSTRSTRTTGSAISPRGTTALSPLHPAGIPVPVWAHPSAIGSCRPLRRPPEGASPRLWPN
jgi:subtilase family serine protease